MAILDELRILNISLAPVPLSLFELALLLFVCFLAYLLYGVLFEPYNRVKKLNDTGYFADSSCSKEEVAQRTQRCRVVGDVPPVYPNGWFGLLESFQLKTAETKEINALGLHLALFRDENGNAHAVDAYCPHLGANLAIGGQVVGSCLECPFHGWRFRGEDGKCVKIPYSDSVPEFAKLKTWPLMEMHGWIYIWYHAEGIEPTWKPPEIVEITKGEWTYRGRSEHLINVHIEDIPENGADPGHLTAVHGPFLTAGTDLRFTKTKLWSFIQHLWKAGWKPCDPPEGHRAELNLEHKVTVFGMRVPLLDMNVVAKQIGPAFVFLEFESRFGKGVYIHNVLPVGPLLQKTTHNIYMERWVPTFIAKFYLHGQSLQFERDIMIWNNKRYEKKPMFVKSKEDSLLSQHRRWYSQFYSENSPRLTDKKNSLEW